MDLRAHRVATDSKVLKCSTLQWHLALILSQPANQGCPPVWPSPALSPARQRHASVLAWLTASDVMHCGLWR